MSEHSPPPDDPQPLRTQLEGWRSDGGWRLDPARFHAMEALARRLPGQPLAVRRLLHAKLQAALADYAGRLAAARQAAAAAAARLAAERPGLARELQRLQDAGDLRGVHRLAATRAAATCPPLALLNQSIRGAAATAYDGAAPERVELASARRFRQTWSRHRARQQVDLAAARRPANAGPLNSHTLVLQSLDLMRELSPDYLRRFLSQVESLQWLDGARELSPPSPARPTKGSRRGRPGK